MTGSPRVSLGGFHASDFSVLFQPDATISGGGGSSFQIRFDPSVVGTRTASVSIANSDADESTYTFSIQGTGSETLPPAEVDIDIYGNGIEIQDGDTTPSSADGTDFGETDVEAGNVSRFFAIHNTGNSPMVLTSTPTANLSGENIADFSVNPPPLSPVPANGSVSFQVYFNPIDVGERTATLTISSTDADENPYTFAIRGKGLPVLRIDDVSVLEGDDSPVTAFFTVRLSQPTTDTVTVNYATSDGLASSGSDYTAVTSSSVTFPPGETEKTASVIVLADDVEEPDETFLVNLIDPVNAIIRDGQARGTIIDNDRDTDADGIPDYWENQYGLDPDDPADAGLDADGDGLSNLEEYQLGTDPLTPRGDINGDGSLDLADALTALSVVTGGTVTAHDVTGDGVVNISDALFVLQILAGVR